MRIRMAGITAESPDAAKRHATATVRGIVPKTGYVVSEPQVGEQTLEPVGAR